MVPGDGHGPGRRRGGDRHDVIDGVRPGERDLEGDHATERTAASRGRCVRPRARRGVATGPRAWSRVVTAGKSRAVRPAGRRVEGVRTGCAVPAAEQVRAQHAVACRVERSTLADQWLPPVTGRIGRTGQGVDDDDLRRRPPGRARRGGTRRSARGVPGRHRARTGRVDALEPAGPRGETDRPVVGSIGRHPAAPTRLPSSGASAVDASSAWDRSAMQVVDVLEADRQADEVRRDSGRDLLLGLELRVGGRGRMDDQRLRVADVGQQAEDLHVVDEPATGLDTALDAERRRSRRSRRVRYFLACLWDGCDSRPG